MLDFTWSPVCLYESEGGPLGHWLRMINCHGVVLKGTSVSARHTRSVFLMPHIYQMSITKYNFFHFHFKNSTLLKINVLYWHWLNYCILRTIDWKVVWGTKNGSLMASLQQKKTFETFIFKSVSKMKSSQSWIYTKLIPLKVLSTFLRYLSSL